MKVKCIFCGNKQDVGKTMLPNEMRIAMFCDNCGAVQVYKQRYNKRITSVKLEVIEEEEYRK